MLGEFFKKLKAQLVHLQIDIALKKEVFIKKINLLHNAISIFQKHATEIQKIIQVRLF